MMAEEPKANNYNNSEFRSYYNLGAGIDAGNTDIESEDGLSYDEMFSRSQVECEDAVSESGSEDVEMVMSRYDPPVHQQEDSSPPDSLASEIKSAELESLESLEEEDVLASYNYINKDAIQEKDVLDRYRYINKDKTKVMSNDGIKQVDCDITEARHSRDSGTSSPSHTSGWALPSIPPDIVASANHVRVVRAAPRQTFRLDLPPAHCDLADIHGTKDRKERHKDQERHKEQQPTFCPHHVQAYTNLEDFEDSAWEQSDFEPGDEAPVDVVVRAGGEGGGAGYESQVQGRRRRQRVVHQIGAGAPVEYTCGPQCCVLM